MSAARLDASPPAGAELATGVAAGAGIGAGAAAAEVLLDAEFLDGEADRHRHASHARQRLRVTARRCGAAVGVLFMGIGRRRRPRASGKCCA